MRHYLKWIQQIELQIVFTFKEERFSSGENAATV